MPIFDGSIWSVDDARRVRRRARVRGASMTCAIWPRMSSRASLACASASRRMSNVTPVILMSICRAVMPVRGAGDLEVHVAEVVLDAGDVGEDDVVVALLDQAHRDARDRRLDRHARVHQRQRRAADRGHRRRAVGLEDVRHDANRVRELLDRRDHRHQRPLGERAVADVAALGAAHEAGLAHARRAGSCSGASSTSWSRARGCRAASPP